MRIIFKTTNFDSKIIEVKICRISSHKSIDEFSAKTTNITQLDFTNYENLVYSIVKANINSGAVFLACHDELRTAEQLVEQKVRKEVIDVLTDI